MSNLPSNWQVKSLGEVASVLTGYPFDSKLFSDNQGFPIIRIRDIKSGSTSTYYRGEVLKDYIIKKGDFLVGMDGEFNLAEWKSGDALLNQRACKIIFDRQFINPKFGYYFIPKKLKEIEDSTAYVTVKHISHKQILNIQIPLPPLPIQKQIAEILEKADQAKQKRKEANELTDEFLQSVFIEMFGDPVKNPKGWRKDELKSIAIIERDSVTSENLGKADLYIGLEHIEKESGKLLGFEYVNEIDLKSNKFKFTSEHVLYGKLRPYLNKVCLPNFNGVCSTDIIPIKPRQNISDKYFLAFLMRMDFFVKEATIKSAGANLPRISPNILEKFKVYVPPLSLQQEFAEIVNKTEALKEKQKQSEQELENLFQSLMQKAFKGELVGTQPPAPSLTKRRGV